MGSALDHADLRLLVDLLAKGEQIVVVKVERPGDGAQGFIAGDDGVPALDPGNGGIAYIDGKRQLTLRQVLLDSSVCYHASEIVIHNIISILCGSEISLFNYPVSMRRTDRSHVFEELAQVSTEAVQVDIVTDKDSSEIGSRFIANITDTLNVRAEASVDSELVGKMYPGCAGTILSVEGDWTQIESGDVTGYVKTEYILSGSAAEELEEEYGRYVGTVTTDVVRVRREMDMDSEAIAMLVLDDEVYVTEELDGWYQVLVNETWEGYVSADYMTVEYKFDTAITIEEEQARIRAALEAERAEKERLAAAQAAANKATVSQTAAQSSSVSEPAVAASSVATTVQAPTQASYDDAYLLACLVSMEAGYEPYEGQLAVANVVLNRLHSGYFGSTISSVIYARGQFPSVNGSVMNGYLQNGPLPQAQQAANEALSGVNNIGSYMYFINVKYGNYASYSDYTIIGNHVFH